MNDNTVVCEDLDSCQNNKHIIVTCFPWQETHPLGPSKYFLETDQISSSLLLNGVKAKGQALKAKSLQFLNRPTFVFFLIN